MSSYGTLPPVSSSSSLNTRSTRGYGWTTMSRAAPFTVEEALLGDADAIEGSPVPSFLGHVRPDGIGDLERRRDEGRFTSVSVNEKPGDSPTARGARPTAPLKQSACCSLNTVGRSRSKEPTAGLDRVAVLVSEDARHGRRRAEALDEVGHQVPVVVDDRVVRRVGAASVVEAVHVVGVLLGHLERHLVAATVVDRILTLRIVRVDVLDRNERDSVQLGDDLRVEAYRCRLHAALMYSS